ncbi:MAG: type II toxin-antitoxin system prevent-host-death family antitoxin [Synergistaceae bacterium]|nr:type II toxin-antitoxin system prevent-host-death family antitoxin [Synergistaceae bacterium]
MQISLSELKIEPGKYIDLADEQDIYVTKDGKPVARITSAKSGKVMAAHALFGILPVDVDLDSAREDRLKD